ncbi:HER204Wp [Eremothecium sinecaudum]|uniref:Glycerophosphocholine acyltransferase 1 n=1 Tax=Eremothecium sinecaudum TaxID=45286 RepID=A0A109UZK8_9SACH|nr:HER204Wp [Eremothecium sinecaudum]AMD21482.1 HER204Wp [Eremothecium sinecaudum]
MNSLTKKGHYLYKLQAATVNHSRDQIKLHLSTMVEANKDCSPDMWNTYKSAFGDLIEILDPIASSVQTYAQPSTLYFRQKLQNGKSHLALDKLLDSAGDLTPQLESFKKKTIQKIQAMDKPLHSIFFNNSLLDKAFYTFTLINIFVIGFILGKCPEWFHVYYTLMFLSLMPVRFYTYYKVRNHYFMADLCYFVNFLCLVFLWVSPGSVHLYQTCFAFTFGSLSFAVITWRNSFVVHSLDKVTSCFIHITPALTWYAITHLIDEDVKAIRFPAASKASSPSWILKTNVFYTSIYYLIWQLLYHYFITLKKKDKIKTGKRVTSFEYLTTHRFKDHWLVKLPPPFPMLVYTLFQYLYQLTSMILCVIWFKHSFAAAGFLLFIILIAGRNGANYYIDHYGKRFEKEVQKLKLQVETLSQQIVDKDSSSPELMFIDSDFGSQSSGQSDDVIWEMKVVN